MNKAQNKIIDELYAPGLRASGSGVWATFHIDELRTLCEQVIEAGREPVRYETAGCKIGHSTMAELYECKECNPRKL